MDRECYDLLQVSQTIIHRTCIFSMWNPKYIFDNKLLSRDYVCTELTSQSATVKSLQRPVLAVHE